MLLKLVKVSLGFRASSRPAYEDSVSAEACKGQPRL
jgi:hypothetical protein